MVPVTFLLPVYNGEKYLAETLLSISNQSFQNFETLIINDGSTDGTQNIIDEFSRRDGRIRSISRENRGLVATLNEGLDRIESKYIARIDADDLCHRQRLELQFQYMEENPHIGVSGTNVKFFGLRDTELKFPHKHEELVAAIPFAPPFSHPSVIFRREVLEKYNLRYDENYKDCEDYKLWLDMSAVTKFGSIPASLLFYRTHGESICHVSTVQEKHARMVRQLALTGLGISFSSIQFHQNMICGNHELMKLEYWPVYLSELLEQGEEYFKGGFRNLEVLARNSFSPEHAQRFIDCVKEAVLFQNSVTSTT